VLELWRTPGNNEVNHNSLVIGLNFGFGMGWKRVPLILVLYYIYLRGFNSELQIGF